jgi:hypothetical protein
VLAHPSSTAGVRVYVRLHARGHKTPCHSTNHFASAFFFSLFTHTHTHTRTHAHYCSLCCAPVHQPRAEWGGVGGARPHGQCYGCVGLHGVACGWTRDDSSCQAVATTPSEKFPGSAKFRGVVCRFFSRLGSAISLARWFWAHGGGPFIRVCLIWRVGHASFAKDLRIVPVRRFQCFESPTMYAL